MTKGRQQLDHISNVTLQLIFADATTILQHAAPAVPDLCHMQHNTNPAAPFCLLLPWYPAQVLSETVTVAESAAQSPKSSTCYADPTPCLLLLSCYSAPSATIMDVADMLAARRTGSAVPYLCNMQHTTNQYLCCLLLSCYPAQIQVTLHRYDRPAQIGSWMS
jgi:hypothetical protein